MKQLPENYPGRILVEEYSQALKERTLSAIQASAVFDKFNFPLMVYITAWNHKDDTIWYEFVGQQFMDLLESNATDISTVFRDSIQDQRLFHYTDLSESEVEEEVISRRQISDTRHNLREKVEKNKQVEAVYQIASPAGRIIWLKDRGRVEVFPDDNITLTLGCLTDVTKEMGQKELLEQIGYFDDLTGLPKRNIMQKLFEVRCGERQRGYIEAFSVIMIDIDHFKLVNDTHGHQMGDFVLKELASLMTLLKRKEEDIGRYGGEEFYGICRGEIQSGVNFAERVRRNIESHVFSHNGISIHITISAGVASTEEMDEGTMSDLLGLADNRLYQAKHEGRNKVVGNQ